jgi:hypothetical protein
MPRLAQGASRLDHSVCNGSVFRTGAYVCSAPTPGRRSRGCASSARFREWSRQAGGAGLGRQATASGFPPTARAMSLQDKRAATRVTAATRCTTTGWDLEARRRTIVDRALAISVTHHLMRPASFGWRQTGSWPSVPRLLARLAWRLRENGGAGWSRRGGEGQFGCTRACGARKQAGATAVRPASRRALILPSGRHFLPGSGEAWRDDDRAVVHPQYRH